MQSFILKKYLQELELLHLIKCKDFTLIKQVFYIKKIYYLVTLDIKSKLTNKKKR